MKSEEYANKSVIGLTLEAVSDVTSGKVFKNIKNGNVDFLTVFTTILGLVAIFLPVMKYGDVYSYSAFDVEKIYTIIGIVIIVASLVFNLAVFIVFAAFSYFNRTKIDLTENLEIAYADEYAKNGDEVTVRAVYSKETAKKLKIKVINDSKEFTIEGLSESYENTESIDEATLEKLKADAKESVQWAVGMSSINFEVSYV